ncbi:hypothetical protein FB45DRAFT_1039397 [Roridomyces roridus]|uniref:Uncharacterized protein n=1 Tax=Roridomyces roridus TaxID=1738132 RepID=A0AAD7B3B5_9AGAR|nr:hypothetical protein FB45DRAFT_1039397 [Roridomyces roridus]
MASFAWFPPSVQDPLPNLVDAPLPQKSALLQVAQQSQSLLEPEHENIVRRQIFLLFYASAPAETRVYEDDNRNEWNALLLGFYTQKEEIVSPTVRFEQTVPFSKNILAEETDPDELSAVLGREVYSNIKFCLASTMTVEAFDVWSDVYRDADSKMDPKSKQVLFPHFIVVHKKPDDTDTQAKAMNRGRAHLISLIAFYAALGIVDRSFYAFVTSGPKGILLMGWKSTQFERTYVFEKNIINVDIRQPSEAYRFAVFLLRLREEQADLMRRVQSALEAGAHTRSEFLGWRARKEADA